MYTKNLFIKPDFQDSSLAFEIDCSYKQLVDIFGKPNADTDGYKVDAEWRLKTITGLYFTIYNYKTGKNYLGDEGLPVTRIRDWHFGLKEGERNQKEIQELHYILKLFGLVKNDFVRTNWDKL